MPRARTSRKEPDKTKPRSPVPHREADEAPVEPAPPGPAEEARSPDPPSPEPGEDGRTGAAREPYLTFWVGDEEYALRVLQAREILEYQPVTPVPTTPPWIRGVMNLRGVVVPVVDLAVKFGLPPASVTSRTCVVVVEVELDGEAAPMGILADTVNQVVELPPEAIEQPPAFGTRVRVDYLLGVGRWEEGLVLILDVDRVLSTDELLGTAAPPETAPSADTDGARIE